MFCTNCGHPNRDDARFCAECGHPLQDEVTVTLPAIEGDDEAHDDFLPYNAWFAQKRKRIENETRLLSAVSIQFRTHRTTLKLKEHCSRGLPHEARPCSEDSMDAPMVPKIAIFRFFLLFLGNDIL